MSTVPKTDDLLFEDDQSKDDLLFADDDVDTNTAEGTPWKILIVDDEEEIHSVTRLVLQGFSFADKEIEWMSAYSGAEACKILRETPDIAVILLDVVMETDNAGLDVVKFIREEMGNQAVRIVLRTGQPGQAPERSVVRNYDINDYKEKTELTSQKLYTLMHTCLRSYQDITTIEANKRGLEKVLDASATIFKAQSMTKFTRGVLEQLTSLLHLDADALYCRTSGIAICPQQDGLKIMTGIGEYENAIGRDVKDVLDPHSLRDLEMALKGKQSIYSDRRYTAYFSSKSDIASILQLNGLRDLQGIDRNLVEIFGRNVGIAFENAHLKLEIEETQKEMVYRLGDAVETRSRETGNHVKRVAEYSKLLGIGCDMGEEEAELLRLAAPMHDVGKIGIPDAILNKPGKLTPDEWRAMQTHAQLGYDMLAGSERPILRAGAEIAGGHHEKWNGAGYPKGLSGEDIPIYGRIAAVADVFDALASDRCYKKAWDMGRVIDFMKEEQGAHFDPKLIDIFFSELDSFLDIRDAYPDCVTES